MWFDWLLLIPFGTLLVKLTYKILPDKEVKKESIFKYLINDVNMRVGGTAVHLENTRLEISRMYHLCIENINDSFDQLINADRDNSKKIQETEDLIDKLNEGITKEITDCIALESNHQVSETYSAYLNIAHNIERISDHAVNLLEYAEEFKNKNITLNELVVNEIKQMQTICNEMFVKSFENNNLEEIEQLEDRTDNMPKEFKVNMIDRLKNSICTAEGSIIYSNILINFERIGDHLLNVSENSEKIK